MTNNYLPAEFLILVLVSLNLQSSVPVGPLSATVLNPGESKNEFLDSDLIFVVEADRGPCSNLFFCKGPPTKLKLFNFRIFSFTDSDLQD